MKPHYLFRGGCWWQFPSLERCRLFLAAAKKGVWLDDCAPNEVEHEL